MEITERQKSLLQKAVLPDHPEKIIGKVIGFTPKDPKHGEPMYGTIIGMRIPSDYGNYIQIIVQGFPCQEMHNLRLSINDDGSWTLISNDVAWYDGTVTL